MLHFLGLLYAIIHTVFLEVIFLVNLANSGIFVDFGMVVGVVIEKVWSVI